MSYDNLIFIWAIKIMIKLAKTFAVLKKILDRVS